MARVGAQRLVEAHGESVDRLENHNLRRNLQRHLEAGLHQRLRVRDVGEIGKVVQIAAENQTTESLETVKLIKNGRLSWFCSLHEAELVDSYVSDDELDD